MPMCADAAQPRTRHPPDRIRPQEHSPLSSKLDATAAARLRENGQEVVAHARSYAQGFERRPDLEPAFLGAQPKVLRRPEIASAAEVEKATRLVCRTVGRLIDDAADVLLVIAHDASASATARSLIEEMTAVGVGSTTVCLGDEGGSPDRGGGEGGGAARHAAPAHRCTGQVFSSLRHRLSRNEGGI